jgi:tRNA threonylcarbamoyl adenosine modification protein YeaZ
MGEVLRVLAIDTALGACAACVVEAGTPAPLSRESIPMERGHAEALLPLIDRVVAAVEGGFKGLDRVAVTIGPGSYTGLRVGIAAARAIGLAAGVPVVGVSTLSALLASLMGGDPRHLLAAAIDARHGHVYLQVMAPGGRIVVPPSHASIREAVRVLGSGPVRLTGSAAQEVATEALTQGIEAMVAGTPLAPEIALVARLGALADPAHALPKPLYLRGPDAKPQDAARIPRLRAGGA